MREAGCDCLRTLRRRLLLKWAAAVRTVTTDVPAGSQAKRLMLTPGSSPKLKNFLGDQLLDKATELVQTLASGSISNPYSIPIVRDRQPRSRWPKQVSGWPP